MTAPRNVLLYEEGDLVDLAATYLCRIVKSHPFSDGNKRTGYVTCLTFLELNGIDLGAPPCLELATLAAAANLVDEAALRGILRQLVTLALDDPEYYARTHGALPW